MRHCALLWTEPVRPRAASMVPCAGRLARRPAWTLAALAVLAAAAGACRPAGPQPAVVPPGGLPAVEPTVRVGIVVDTSAVVVGATTEYDVAVSGADGGIAAAPEERWTFTADAAGLVVGASDAGRRIGPVAGVLAVRPRGGGAVLIDGRPFRGQALVRGAGPGRVTAINTLELEAYLLGVVPEEIGIRPLAEIEAVKAQAVAARTYAVSNLGSRQTLGFDFFATVADQVYGGLAKEDPVVTRAVRETRGEIATYDGVPILAYYHSTCGGRTAAIDEVWRRAPLPYLTSVSDAAPGGGYFCEFSNRFRWTESWTGESLAAILARTLVDVAGAPPGAVRRLLGLEITGRTPSGRAEALRIQTDAGEFLVRGDSIRWALSPAPGRILNSTLIELEQAHADGDVAQVTVNGGGWGHGVGMCQIGAIGRARAGQKYRGILETYYRGIRIEQLY